MFLVAMVSTVLTAGLAYPSTNGCLWCPLVVPEINLLLRGFAISLALCFRDRTWVQFPPRSLFVFAVFPQTLRGKVC